MPTRPLFNGLDTLLHSGAMQACEEAAHRDDLLQHLERLDLIVQRAVRRARLTPDDPHDLDGFLLPPRLIDTPWMHFLGRPRWAMADDDSGLCRATDGSGDEETPSRLQRLTARFGLSPLERDLLLLALLPWFDARYAVLFSELQRGDEPLPTAQLALQLLAPPGWGRTLQMSSLAPQAPLLRHRLLGLRSTRGPARHWGELALHADPALYHHLAGHQAEAPQAGLPPALEPCARWLPTPDAPDLHPWLTERLARYCFSADRSSLRGSAAPARVLLLRGPAGSARALALAHAAAAAGWPLLSVDLDLLPERHDEALEVLLLALRETRLHSAGLVLRALPALARQRRGLFTPLSRRLASHGWPVACLVEPHQPLITLGSEVPQWVVEMPEPAQRPVSERPAG